MPSLKAPPGDNCRPSATGVQGPAVAPLKKFVFNAWGALKKELVGIGGKAPKGISPWKGSLEKEDILITGNLFWAGILETSEEEARDLKATGRVCCKGMRGCGNGDEGQTGKPTPMNGAAGRAKGERLGGCNAWEGRGAKNWRFVALLLCFFGGFLDEDRFFLVAIPIQWKNMWRFYKIFSRGR